MNTGEIRNIYISSPLGSRARAKILAVQECLIMQGMSGTNRVLGRYLQLLYMKTIVNTGQIEVLTSVLRHAIADPSECGLSFVLGELEMDYRGSLVISVRGENMKSLQERLKAGCDLAMNTDHSTTNPQHLGDIVLFTPKKEGRYDHGELNRRLTHDKMEDVFLINEVNAFSSHDSRSDCMTINLLSPCNAKYQAEASQADPLMHPWKEINTSMYTTTIVLDLPDECKAIIMGGVLEYCTSTRK